MLLCSIQNQGVLKQNWVQVRPRVTQAFGLNPQIYSRFGMKGHNGIDYGVPVGTQVFAPMSGEVKVVDSGTKGYGLHIKIRNPYRELECVVAHLSQTYIANNAKVNMGDMIALSGNTGFSTGPHVHEGFRRIKAEEDLPIFQWKVMDYNNGYKGYFDHMEFVLNWKGSLLKNTL